MKIDEVHLNRDVGSAMSDAFNIRRNASDVPFTALEWKDGRPPKPATYARFELGPTVTIKVRITYGPPGASREIRAIDPWVVPATPGGCFGWLMVLIAKLARALNGNVLGEVAENTVDFDSSGDSGAQTFIIVNHKLGVTPVGTRKTTWTWQVFENGSWTDIGSTEHPIFVVLEVPKTPW